MENEKMTKCDNCDKLIEQSKMLLHERFCKLNIKKCSICKSPVLIEEYEDHMDEYHQEIECEFCKKTFSNADIEVHKRQCDCQLVFCMYCEMKVPKREKKEHEYICGAKTEECEICKQFVQIKDMKAHKIKGCKPPTVVTKPTVEQRKPIVDKKDNKEKAVENKIRNVNYNKENEVVRNMNNNTNNVKYGNVSGGGVQKKNEVGVGGYNNNYNYHNNVGINKGDKSGVNSKPNYIVGNNVNNNNNMVHNNNFNYNNNVNKNQVRVEEYKPSFPNTNSKTVTQKPQPTAIPSSQIKGITSSSKSKPAFVHGKGMKFSNGFNNYNNSNSNTNKPTPMINNSRVPVKQQPQQLQQSRTQQQKPAQPQKQPTLQTKSSMKFVPTITKGQMNKSILPQKPQQQEQRKNTRLPSSKQPFNISHFDSGDYLPDDIDYKDLGIPYSNDPTYNQMSLEERNLQEIIARSMTQK